MVPLNPKKFKKSKKKISLNSPSQMGFDGVKKQDRKFHAWAPLRDG